jgi:hypothetical protein
VAAVLALAAAAGPAAAQHHMHAGFARPQMMGGNAFVRQSQFFRSPFLQAQFSAFTLSQQRAFTLSRQRAFAFSQRRALLQAQESALFSRFNRFAVPVRSTSVLSATGTRVAPGVTRFPNSGGFVVPFRP